MATAAQFRNIALSLPGTVEYPHFDRAAFKVARTYATLAPDRKTANFKFALDEQELKCMVAPDAFAVIPNGFGRMGWTTGTLKALSVAELKAALEIAWQHAQKKPAAKKRR
jgi:hypothetical protein